MDFFPPDVRYRINGDKQAGEDLVGEARNMLVKATLMQQDNPHTPVQLVKYLPGGGSIIVLLFESSKIITINPPPPVPKVEEVDEVALDIAAGIHVLCGIVRNQENVVVDGTTYLKDFRPTLPTSRAYRIPNSYTNNARLANLLYAPNASLYSGAMKRVVAAVEGLGKIKEAGGSYLTPTPVTRTVVNNYQYGWTKTQGIYKAGPKNHWLVEISAENGILAMPLPLLNSTRGVGYLKRLVRLGDTGGATIVREFGGLPSGETFPTGTDLTDAITDGRVLRLKTASALSDYYGAGAGELRMNMFGWAFSESGNKAVTTRFVYHPTTEDPLKYELRGQLWQIDINLSLHDRSTPRPDPVGTGSAVMYIRVNGRRLSKQACQNFVGAIDTEQSTPFLQNFINTPSMVKFPVDYPSEGYIGVDFHQWGSPVHAFFDGEQLVYTRWVPPYLWYMWLHVGFETHSNWVGHDGNTGPFYIQRQDSGVWQSPAGFVMNVLPDPRELIGSERSNWGNALTTSDSGIDSYAPMEVERTVAGHYFPWSHWQAVYGWTFSPSFAAIPTGYSIPVDSLYYVATGAVPGSPTIAELIAEKVASNYGVGSIIGREDSSTALSFVVPGWCREGGVVVKWHARAVLPSGLLTRKGYGYFTGLGQMDVPLESTFRSPESAGTAPIFFGIVVNPGPTRAYVMTKHIGTTYPGYGLPYTHPGYSWSGLLPSTDSGFTIRVYNTTFIGSY